jgi:SIT family siderophore-iron:H+ symporter-like MFS transporter
MPGELTSQLGNSTLAALVYADPYTQAALYPVGTPERAGMIAAYAYVQKILCSELSPTCTAREWH